MIKIGLDLHGVVDTFPEKFSELAWAIISGGGEVHIITGLKRDPEIIEQLTEWNVPFTKYFSIVDYLEEKGVEVEWRANLPYADETEWDKAKADYCDENLIDFMFDDSFKYGPYFDNIDTTYLQLRNVNRTIYEVRK